MRIKNFKIFNEELKSGTYYSASNKLKDIGHDRRSGEIRKWGDIVQAREKEERVSQRQSYMRKFDPFEMTIYSCRWDRDTKTTIESYLTDGLFYIEPSFPYDWFGDTVYDWRYHHEYALWMPLEFGVSPANEETALRMKEIEENLSDDSWDDIHWMTRIMVEIIPEGSNTVIDNGKVSVESRESDISLFSNRKEAIRFKNLLVGAMEGRNTFGQNQWYPNGISSSFEKFFEAERKFHQNRINKGEELLYNAKWYEPTYDNKVSNDLTLSWFTTNRGYRKEDIQAIAKLKEGEIWYSDDHEVTAVKCDDVEKALSIRESDIPKIASSIRKMSVNKLYRN